MSKMNSKVKGKYKFPDVYALLFFLAIVAMILTWIIPAGAFDTVKDGNLTKVVPGTFHVIDQNPQNVWDIFMSIVTGFQRQAKLIFMVFFIGAAVYMLEISNTINVAFKRFVNVEGKEWVTILIIMAFMSIGGATGVFGNATLALIPIGIMISAALKLDKTTGFAMIFFGSFSGFNVGWANVSSIGIAHQIAELPIFSGFGVRVIFHIINFALSYGFVMLYVNRIKKDPYKSLNYVEGMEINDFMGKDDVNDVNDEMTTRHKLSLFVAAIGFIGIIVGALKFKWGPDEFSAIFLMVAIAVGLISGFGINGTANNFVKGCSSMVGAAFIIGFANAITILMANGQILDTIVYYLSVPVDKFGPILGANFMLLTNIFVNFFISSGSGQATAVMPIMIPIADLTGITRQVATQAFQFGDGFTNIVIPTVGTLMGGLGFARLGYNKYLKWVFPLIAIQLALSFVAITILQIIQWGPM